MDHRLKKNKQFSYLYKKGNRKNSKFLTLFEIDSKYKCYKIGFSVNKKIGKANVRNKVKRRLKEIVRTNNLCSDYKNYILLAKTGIDELSFDELKTEVVKVFKKW